MWLRGDVGAHSPLASPSLCTRRRLTRSYFNMKAEVLAALGFAPEDSFPVFADRFPNQLLAYARLARLQDPALFAKVS